MNDAALKRYDITRRNFLSEVNSLIALCQREAKGCLKSPERHDYLMYLGQNLVVLAEQVKGANLASFEEWKTGPKGARRTCNPLDEC